MIAAKTSLAPETLRLTVAGVADLLSPMMERPARLDIGFTQHDALVQRVEDTGTC
jgi:hypothetical protein